MATVGNTDRIVKLNGIDITKWVIKLPTLPQLKPDWGKIPSLPELNITVRSDDNAFSLQHPVSFVYQKRLDKMPLVVSQFGAVVWTGFLKNVKTNLSKHQSVLVAESALDRKLNTSGRLDSDLLTPARAAQNLLILHGIDTDAISFGKAHAILDDIPCRVRVNPSVLEWQGTLGDLLQTIGVAGIGRYFMTPSGAIGFDSFALDLAPVISSTITDRNIMSPDVKIDDESMDTMGGYTVDYVHGRVSSEASEKLMTMDFTGTRSVSMETPASATYTGSQWVALSRVEYTRMKLAIKKELAWTLTLSSWITIDSTQMGINRSAEVIGIDDSDPRFAWITVRINKEVP